MQVNPASGLKNILEELKRKVFVEGCNNFKIHEIQYRHQYLPHLQMFKTITRM